MSKRKEDSKLTNNNNYYFSDLSYDPQRRRYNSKDYKLKVWKVLRLAPELALLMKRIKIKQYFNQLTQGLKHACKLIVDF